MVYRGTKPLTKWATGEKVLPDNWNKAKNRVRRARGVQYKLLNDKFSRIAMDVKSYALKMEMAGEVVTPKKIKDYLNAKYRGKVEIEGVEEGSYKDLVSYMKHHMGQMKAQGKPIWKSYDSSIKILQAYFRAYGYHDYEDIDFNFYSNFINYLYAREYTTNYIGRNIKNLKTVMGYAYDEKMHRNDIFRSKRFRVLSEKVFNIYLSEEELEHIHAQDLGQFPMLDKTKDLFLIGCYVGSRFSNWVNMGEAQLTDEYIIYESVKHRERIEFPLHWIVKEIRQKYGGVFPKPITNQVFNRFVKKVGEKSGIDEDVLIVKTVGGKRVSEKQAKYKLITSHTARRSLATNLYLNGVPIKIAMYATGHTKVEQYLSYVKTGLREESEALKKNPFFRKK